MKIEGKGEDTGHILIYCILPDLELQNTMQQLIRTEFKEIQVIHLRKKT